MSLAIPGQLVEMTSDHPHVAVVEVSNVRRTINVALLEDDGLLAGDWVLIQVGVAMSRISEEAAQEQIRLMSVRGEDAQALQELDAYED